ncbi:MAG: hypothetical protein ABI659_05795, partial [Nitrosospira sp.]
QTVRLPHPQYRGIADTYLSGKRSRTPVGRRLRRSLGRKPNDLGSINDGLAPRTRQITLNACQSAFSVAFPPAPLISLEGWHLADKQKAKMPLSGTLDPGVMLCVDIKPPVALSNKGDIITMLNQNGLKVHGVSYTKQQANQPGWTIVF